MFFEIIGSAWKSIIAYRVRSFLTCLGIVVGIASVIMIVSILQGMASSISSSFDNLGANSISVRSNTSFEKQLQGQLNVLTLSDYKRLQQSLGDSVVMTPTLLPYGIFGSTIRNAKKSAFGRVMAVTANYDETHKTYADFGRFIAFSDDVTKRKVAVLGSKTRKDLGLPADCIGAYINIGEDWFKVIGVMSEKGEVFGISQDEFVLIPFSTGEAIAPTTAKQDVTIVMAVKDTPQVEFVKAQVTSILRRAHGVQNGDEDDFVVETAEQLKKSFSEMTSTITFVVGSVVGISLLVGGIGIMNIMLVSVRERTREIGICKALGAQRTHILAQFLVEATLLSLLGGIIGLALGWLGGTIVAAMLPGQQSAVVPLWAAVLSIAFSGSIGVIFGVIPAAQAASLNPVDALRYE
jgi:putative ABC transport system permease protein